MEFVIPIIIVLIIVFLVLNIKIVPQSKAYVIERLGTYSATWQTGLHIKIPFIERVANGNERLLDVLIRHACGAHQTAMRRTFYPEFCTV